jgi:hypothetical protein
LYATGEWSDARIAAHLNTRGYRMRSKRHPQGYPFTKDTLTAMLDNPFYAGWVTYTGDGYSKRTQTTHLKPGKHPPILSQGLFERAVAVRAQRRNPGSTPVRHAHIYTAAGLVHCACCRQPMRAQGAALRKPTYRDVSPERGIVCTAHRRSIPAPIVDEYLVLAVRGLQLPDDWHARAVAHVETAAQDTARLLAQRTTLERRLQHHKRLLMDGDIDQADYRAEKARIEAELATLQPAREVVDLELAAARLRELHALWDHATPAERREITRTLFTAVYCDLDGQRVLAVQLERAFLPLRNALSKCTPGGSDGIIVRGRYAA